jgi:hypothetical protein
MEIRQYAVSFNNNWNTVNVTIVFLRCHPDTNKISFLSGIFNIAMYRVYLILLQPWADLLLGGQGSRLGRQILGGGKFERNLIALTGNG